MNKQTWLLSMVGVLYIAAFFPAFDWSLQIKAAAVLVIIQILWIGRVFPLAYSSVLLILLLSFHFFSYDETLSYFGSGLVWLLFSTFILAHAFITTGLASRVSLFILSLSRGSSKLLILVSFLLMFVLTVFIPSNIGKGSLISSILHDISRSLQRIQPSRHIATTLFIGITYVCAISAAFVPTGASSTIYAFGIFSDLSDKVTYLHWLLYFGVPILVFVGLLWLIFNLFFPAEDVDPSVVKNLITSKFSELGPWSAKEKKMALIMVVTLSLWVTQPLHGYSIPLVGLLGASMVVLPYIGVMTWEAAKEGVNWDMMIFFAATLMLSNMLIDTGTIDHVVDYLVAHSHDYPSIILVIGLIVITALIRIIFVNVLGFLTIMLPMAVTLGDELAGVTSLTLAMAVYLIGVPGFLLITQSPVHLISYSYGYFTERELLRVGTVAMAVWIVIIFVTMTMYWNLVI
ncbi:SLC13 family permease [Thalassobacillus sp. CUG 92003]|uniref:SLC13 family permease n=1 Tax=Thalassobacillus sp. CUG 92003 TaxID=2736641 RepID=UPI002106BF30|nr:SLC13 family permease [Thalassobacillus sp. CUG 92003]